jgi:hypothetical protein
MSIPQTIVYVIKSQADPSATSPDFWCQSHWRMRQSSEP